MKRERDKKGKKSKSMSMMGGKPFAKSAKKPEPDDKPHTKAGPPSVNKNTSVKQNARVKKLTGLML